ncbi:hypothetical protein DEH18_00630 [Streptomyces sp. NHF165]|uniref:hypothetical protein n=1 Tax=Streptomyces sp. NHF165 TaxID=2175864 RepID=UPI00132EA46A|nr:hypothetical protein [Streptomyces sp. NHF165]QHF92658.1 hypothetical protein DEH18_00630 [Streptomyces sp. NHF165]
MARSERQVAIEVGGGSLRRGDVIQVGGQSMAVVDICHLTGGAKLIAFRSGDVLTIMPRTTLVVLRTVAGWEGPVC